jgi:serine/threonine-protein kinase
VRAGRYDAGYDAALRAEMLAEQSGDPILRADALVQLGEVRSERGDWAGAEATLADAYWLASEHGYDRAAAEAALRLVIATSEASARYDEAKRWAEHARSIYERIDAEPIELGRLHSAIGALEYRRGDFVAAVDHMRESVRLFEGEVGRDDVRLSTALGNLGGMLSQRGEYDEAEAILRRVVAMRERALGDDHPEVAQALNILASCLAGTGRPEEALALQERAVAVWERSLGDDHPLVAMALNNLGTLSEQLGDDETALRSHERALAIREARLGAAHPDVGVSSLNAGVVYQRLERNDDARAAFERALEILQPALGDQHGNVAYARMAYGSLLRTRGDGQRARELLEQASATFDATPGNPYSPIARAELGTTLFELGRADEAVALLERALGENVHGSFGPVERARTSFTLARALAATRAHERARTVALDAMRELANADLPDAHDGERGELLRELDAWARGDEIDPRRP